jgi:heme exporter protein A
MQLVADDLTCQRSGRVVFAGLSFVVEAGSALAITGANGAGKSSLLRLVAGLIAPAGGAIRLMEAQDDAPLAEQCHYLGHRDALKPALTPRELLDFWRDFLGSSGTGGLAPPDALDRLGIGHAADLPSGYLSAGQRRRLALARLLVAPRPIWLLDEPTTALDTASQELLWQLARAHLGDGGLIMIATHAEPGIPAHTLALGRAKP